MLHRIHGKIQFECDTCGDSLDTGESEFGDALQSLRDEGWIARKNFNEWSHECNPCQQRRTK